LHVERAPESSDALRVVHLAFDVLRVEMPLDGDMNSRKIWNHVDELRVGNSAPLARNGLRVGAGSSGAWPAIAAILDACRARTSRDQLFAQAAAPLMIELGAAEQGSTFFAYGADQRLVGKTFEGGSKILQLDYAYHPHLDGATDLAVGFEVRRERGELVWERQPDGSARQVPAVDRHVFDGLRTEITIGAGEFLVVGPSDRVENEYIVGSRFFTRGDGAERFETLLFITPQPFQSASVRQRN
jgi:hypothetical protein